MSVVFWQVGSGVLQVFLCICLGASDTEHFFMCLFATCIFSLVNVCSCLLPIFYLGSLCFLPLSLKVPLSDVRFASMSS